MKNPQALVDLFNGYEIHGPNEETAFNLEYITDELGLAYDVSGDRWSVLKKKEPRMISTLGISASKALSNFTFAYKKFYRMDKVSAAFYQLTDDEIADMFVELPYYLKAYFGNETWMPTADNFLKEKLWTAAYPNRIAGDRKRVVNTKAEDWWTYIESLPPESRSAIEIYKEQGMSFTDFKALICAG